jgi:hypothetical protein
LHEQVGEDVYESIARTESVLQAGAGDLMGLAVAYAGSAHGRYS